MPAAIATPPSRKSSSTLVTAHGPIRVSSGKGETRTKTPITLAMLFCPSP